MGWCWNDLGWGSWSHMGIVSPIFNLVFFVGVLAVLGLGTLWLIRQLGRRSADSPKGTVPLDIARQRLAAGEISVTEFDEIQGRLQS
jgi:uncharacterized membrane protein